MSNWSTPGMIRANFDEFKKLDVKTRWSAFGEIVYPKVNKQFPAQSQKITGMLIDDQTFTPDEILINIEDEATLMSLAAEAHQLLLQVQNQN